MLQAWWQTDTSFTHFKREILQPATPRWRTHRTTCSAFLPESLAALWETIRKFHTTNQDSGTFEARRKHQSILWMHTMIAEELRNDFFRSEQVKLLLPEIERQVATQTLPAAAAVRMLALLENHPRRPDYDRAKLQQLRLHFEDVYRQLSKFTSPDNERVDSDILVFQVPGGMPGWIPLYHSRCFN